jgi:hypothetical protein
MLNRITFLVSDQALTNVLVWDVGVWISIHE